MLVVTKEELETHRRFVTLFQAINDNSNEALLIKTEYLRKLDIKTYITYSKYEMYLVLRGSSLSPSLGCHNLKSKPP